MRASEKRTLLCPLLGSLTWAFRAHKRPEGKRGNGRWPDTRDGDRTRDPRFRKPTLYPLSYASQKVY
jgi:hypothetical protein